MKSSAKKVELAPYDDLFSTEESRQDAKLEKIQEIPLSELHPFKGHPFKVKDDEAMMETADSVRQYGVLVPAIARPDPEGGYELVAGHRRHRASELAEKETMPVIVRDLDDDAATIIMVDSNLQRESLLPSERAFAYKMKLEAMKHQGARGDLTSSQLGTKLRADELLAQQAGSSRNQVQRYMRDFYDIAILQQLYGSTLDPHVLHDALLATAHKRGTERHLAEAAEVFDEVENSPVMQDLWAAYQKKFSYASDLGWNTVMAAVRQLFARCEGTA